jgi:hypothetical protein
MQSRLDEQPKGCYQDLSCLGQSAGLCKGQRQCFLWLCMCTCITHMYFAASRQQQQMSVAVLGGCSITNSTLGACSTQKF